MELSNRTVLLAAIVTIVGAVIAIIMNVIMLSQNARQDIRIGSSYEGSTYSDSAHGDNERIWQIALPNFEIRLGYIDDVTGEFQGFSVDLANAVCQIANKNCVLVFDSLKRCWDSKSRTNQTSPRPTGGRGLFSGYYDACIGWIKTYGRDRVFKFSLPYSIPWAGVFIVKKGNSEFNWRNLTDVTIGLVDGAAFSEYCIAREKERITGSDLRREQIVYYEGYEELANGLKTGEVDAGFDYEKSRTVSDPEIEVASDQIFSCVKDALSLMTRSDNRLIEWWDPAFETLMASPKWKTLCDGLKDVHGHIPGPNPENFCLNY